MHPTASVSLVVAFCVVVAVVVVAVVAGVFVVAGRDHVRSGTVAADGLRAHPAWRARAVIAAAVWLAATAGVGVSGVLLHVEARPPPFLIVLLLSAGVAVVVGVSDVGAALARLPLWWLVGFQAFRLPLELVMHAAADEGVMPQVMSFSGRNVDIVAGVCAVVVAVALRRGASPAWALAWLVGASATLLNVVVVAVLATPMFRFFGDDEVNVWIAWAPFVWLPTVLVASALAGHIVLARALARAWAQQRR